MAAARALARDWAGQGFTVWIYDREHRSTMLNTSDLRVIDVVEPM